MTDLFTDAPGDGCIGKATEGKKMATEYADLEPEDQEIVSNALDRAIATFQDAGLPVESLDHDALLTALVDLFMRASN